MARPTRSATGRLRSLKLHPGLGLMGLRRRRLRRQLASTIQEKGAALAAPFPVAESVNHGFCNEDPNPEQTAQTRLIAMPAAAISVIVPVVVTVMGDNNAAAQDDGHEQCCQSSLNDTHVNLLNCHLGCLLNALTGFRFRLPAIRQVPHGREPALFAFAGI